MSGAQSRTVRCPQCGKEALFAPENKFRPFCTERCKLIDLGDWASEAYKVPTVSQNPDDEPEAFLDDSENPEHKN